MYMPGLLVDLETLDLRPCLRCTSYPVLWCIVAYVPQDTISCVETYDRDPLVGQKYRQR